MSKTETDVFIFSAGANAMGGTIEKPSKAFLTDTPSAALPVTGGLLSQTKEGIAFKIETLEILRIGRASATVLGEKRGDHFITLATATVENLNILDVITADRIVSRVTSIYPAGKKGEELLEKGWAPSEFCFAGSHFDNLRIDGKHYDCRPAHPKEAVASERAGHCRVKKADYLNTECQVVPVHEFGTVHLGDLVIYGGRATLTMLRIELGCPIQASLSGPSSGGNGAPRK